MALVVASVVACVCQGDEVSIKIASQLEPSVYAVVNRTSSESWHGTAFRYGPDHIFVTNKHVLRGLHIGDGVELFTRPTETVDARLDSKPIRARVIYLDPATDIGLLQVDEVHSVLPISGFTSSSSGPNPPRGASIWTIGFASSLDLLLASGQVSGYLTDGSLHYDSVLILDIPISGGSSGSPLVNHEADLVGILTGSISSENGNFPWAYAIPKSAIDSSIHSYLEPKQKAEIKFAGYRNLSLDDEDVFANKISLWLTGLKQLTERATSWGELSETIQGYFNTNKNHIIPKTVDDLALLQVAGIELAAELSAIGVLLGSSTGTFPTESQAQRMDRFVAEVDEWERRNFQNIILSIPKNQIKDFALTQLTWKANALRLAVDNCETLLAFLDNRPQQVFSRSELLEANRNYGIAELLLYGLEGGGMTLEQLHSGVMATSGYGDLDTLNDTFESLLDSKRRFLNTAETVNYLNSLIGAEHLNPRSNSE